MAAVKGTSDLSWFDELKQQSVQAAKGTVAEDISIETDAGAIRFAFETIDASFERLRRGLIKKD
ncbi:hypothetical protein G3A39_42980 [Paraburkholderia aspalathi]|nr:hypothetical protein [Paraburkholderia aspalathi]